MSLLHRVIGLVFVGSMCLTISFELLLFLSSSMLFGKTIIRCLNVCVITFFIFAIPLHFYNVWQFLLLTDLEFSGTLAIFSIFLPFLSEIIAVFIFWSSSFWLSAANLAVVLAFICLLFLGNKLIPDALNDCPNLNYPPPMSFLGWLINYTTNQSLIVFCGLVLFGGIPFLLYCFSTNVS